MSKIGIIVQINGQDLKLWKTDAKGALEKGVDYKLEKAFNLGQLKTFKEWVTNTAHIPLPTATDFPPPLEQIVGALDNTDIEILEAEVHLPPKQSGTNKKKPDWALTLKATLKPPIDLSPIPLQVKGIVFARELGEAAPTTGGTQEGGATGGTQEGGATGGTQGSGAK